MMQHEFEKLCSEYMEKDVHVSDDMYKTIEYVYMWHPSISELGGKTQIVHLFCDFGFEFIKNMVPDAETMDQIDKEIKDLKLQIHQLEIDKNVLLGKWGN